MTQDESHLQERYDRFSAKGLKPNLTRGNPSPAQLDLSTELLSLPSRKVKALCSRISWTARRKALRCEEAQSLLVRSANAS